nr:hypothetical protein [Tanacetum cinerariifolium]
ASAKDTMVCDDVTQRVLRRKRRLAYFDANKLKMPWLMHEYTMNDPKIVTSGSRGHYKDNNKIKAFLNVSQQHLPLSPGTNSRFPERLVVGDTFLRRHVARDKWNGKARMGNLPGRHQRAHIISVKQLSATVEGFLERHVPWDTKIN